MTENTHPPKYSEEEFPDYPMPNTGVFYAKNCHRIDPNSNTYHHNWYGYWAGSSEGGACLQPGPGYGWSLRSCVQVRTCPDGSYVYRCVPNTLSSTDTD